MCCACQLGSPTVTGICVVDDGHCSSPHTAQSAAQSAHRLTESICSSQQEQGQRCTASGIPQAHNSSQAGKVQKQATQHP